METALSIRAGARARAAILRDGGLDPQRIGRIVGASGGPKWLALSRLDRAIWRHWLGNRSGPLPLIGSSIGNWRHVCYALPDPVDAFDRFEASYLAYRYVKGETAADITRGSRAVLDDVLGAGGVASILHSGSPMRLCVLTSRGRHLLGTERRPLLMAGIALSATANLASSRLMRGFYERVLFADPRLRGDIAAWRGPAPRRLDLTADNLADAVMASSAIPTLIEPGRDLSGAPPGLYWDGGILDYHPVIGAPAEAEGSITLFPHFYDRLIPGWFDKPLKWRHRRTALPDDMLLIAPSPGFVDRLPYGKIPDRKDFLRLSEAERLAYWRRVLAETDRLADEFAVLVTHGELAGRLYRD